MGEIDLIARRGGTIAFVEVKARPTRDVALEAVSPRQARRMVGAARYWLSLQPPATAGPETGALTSSSSRHTCCRAISPTPSAPTCGNTMTLNTAVQMDPIGSIEQQIENLLARRA
jgi:hypothetical protein